MKDLSLSERFFIIAFDRQTKDYLGVFQKQKLRCLSVSVLLDFYINNILIEDGDNYLFTENPKDLNNYESFLYNLFSNKSPREFKKWIKVFSRLSNSNLKTLEKFVADEMIKKDLVEIKPSLLSSSLFLDSAGIEDEIFRSKSNIYQNEIEFLKAEWLEPGNISDESIVLFWLLEKASLTDYIFSGKELYDIGAKKYDVYNNYKIAKLTFLYDIVPLHIRIAVNFLILKDKVFSKNAGLGLAYIYPALHRKEAIFMDTEASVLSSKEFFPDIKRRLEAKGHVCEIKSQCKVVLMEIDGDLYQFLPTAITPSKLPIQGVRLRRYII